jgi:hypothetical protein
VWRTCGFSNDRRILKEKFKIKKLTKVVMMDLLYLFIEGLNLDPEKLTGLYSDRNADGSSGYGETGGPMVGLIDSLVLFHPPPTGRQLCFKYSPW